MWLIDWLKRRRRPQPAAKKERLRILVLSVPLEERITLDRLGRQQDWDVHFSSTPDGFRLLDHSAFEVILLDRNQHGNPWREVMSSLAARSPRSCILLVSPVNDDYVWREVMQRGGYDILTRPLRDKSVIQTIQAAALFASPKDTPLAIS